MSGWGTSREELGSARQACLDARPLTILDVRRAFDGIAAASGTDSVRARLRLLAGLLGQATDPEREVLLKSIFGEMRIGVNEGVLLQGIADAAGGDGGAGRAGATGLRGLGRGGAGALA